ncbi:MAG: DNA repair protein RadC [Nitrospira sp.]|nr:MAG: DNA repair protein RadC [Nitrospira sp.]
MGEGTLSRQLQTRRLPAAPVPIGYCARKRRFSYFRIEQSSTRLHVARAHNHPSGDITPSPEDRILTKRLREAGDLFGITLLDHLILAEEHYYSFADQGWPGA